jgi:hypothetical protein
MQLKLSEEGKMVRERFFLVYLAEAHLKVVAREETKERMLRLPGRIGRLKAYRAEPCIPKNVEDCRIALVEVPAK